MEELFPRPTEAPRRSPAPDVITEISEKGAILEWLAPLESPEFPPVHRELLHPPGGGEGWCNPDAEVLELLQLWDWLMFKWLLADRELLCRCRILECEWPALPPCKYALPPCNNCSANCSAAERSSELPPIQYIKISLEFQNYIIVSHV